MRSRSIDVAAIAANNEFVDTNVLLDAIAGREPFRPDAEKIITLILDGKLEGYITANSTADVFYIARKYLGRDKLRDTMRSLFTVFSIVDVKGADCHEALNFPFDDYEDALLAVCAKKEAIDYIVTRDEEFLEKAKSSVPVISPSGLIRKLE